MIQIEYILFSTQTPFEKLNVYKLKDIITPCVAKNIFEQQEVVAIIEDYILETLRFRERETPKPTIELPAPIPKRFYWVMLFFALAFLLIYLIQPFDTKKKELVTKTVTTEMPTIDTVATTEPKQTSSMQPERTPDQIPYVYNNQQVSIQMEQPIVPEKHNNLIYTTVIFGTLVGVVLHFFVFYTRKKKRVLDEEISKEKKTYFNETKPLQQANSDSVLLDITLDDLIRNREYLPSPFTQQEHRLLLPQLLKSLKQNNIPSNADEWLRQIDFKSTLNATIRHAGFPMIKHQRIKPSNLTLFVFNWNDRYVPITGLVTMLIEKMQARLRYKIYFLNYDTQNLIELKGDKPIPFREFIDIHKQAHLMLIGNLTLLESLTERSKEMNSTFSLLNSCSAVHRKTWISTSFDLPDTKVEQRLSGYGFQCGSLNLDEFAQAIHGYTTHRVQVETIRPQEAYDLNRIKTFLGNTTLFQTFCALSIYPKLSWNLILNLFLELFERNGYLQTEQHAKEYQLLLKLCQLPALSKEELPMDFRSDMMKQLSPQNEIFARNWMLNSLQEVVKRNNGLFHVAEELHYQIMLNKALLHQLAPDQFAAYKPDLQSIQKRLTEVKDPATLQHLERLLSLPTQTQVPADKKLIRVLDKQVFTITLARAVVLCIPFFLFFALFTKFKPRFIYPRDDEITYPIHVRIHSNLCKSLTKIKFYHADTLSFLEWFPGDSTTLYLDEKMGTSLHIGAVIDHLETRSVLSCTHQTINIQVLPCAE